VVNNVASTWVFQISGACKCTGANRVWIDRYEEPDRAAVMRFKFLEDKKRALMSRLLVRQARARVGSRRQPWRGPRSWTRDRMPAQERVSNSQVMIAVLARLNLGWAAGRTEPWPVRSETPAKRCPDESLKALALTRQSCHMPHATRGGIFDEHLCPEDLRVLPHASRCLSDRSFRPTANSPNVSQTPNSRAIIGRRAGAPMPRTGDCDSARRPLPQRCNARASRARRSGAPRGGRRPPPPRLAALRARACRASRLRDAAIHPLEMPIRRVRCWGTLSTESDTQTTRT